jgi:CheY-like chemotaxis protein
MRSGVESDPATKGLIIIALTAFALKGDRERILGARFDDHLANRAIPENCLCS